MFLSEPIGDTGYHYTPGLFLLTMQFSYKAILVSVYILLLCPQAHGQVKFKPGTNLCEDSSWTLAWHDEFSGDRLDSNKWYTYIDDDNWVETPPGSGQYVVAPYAMGLHSRTGQGTKVIFRDSNITVRDGSCFITCKYQPSTWQQFSRNFTSGILMAKNPAISMPLYFRQGRYDIRAKLPPAKGVWITFWLFGGGSAGREGTEIDMLEYNPSPGRGRYVTEYDEVPYHIHGRMRGPSFDKYPDLDGDYKQKNLEDWHLYSTTWDDNFIFIYCDSILRATIPRYIDRKGRSPGCLPSPGETYMEDAKDVFPKEGEAMKLLYSFDMNDNLYNISILGIPIRLPGWLVSHDKIDSRMPDRVTEVDFIRVYQRSNKIQDNLSKK
jgi:hypothetical protein